jgi:acyl dehydratase
MANPIDREALTAMIGQILAQSDWTLVDQAQIDAFAEVSGDRQFLHIDPVRAAMTEFGGTIAHGLLTLSMMSGMAFEAMPQVEGQSACVNYGFDKVRFLAPVPVGGRSDLMVRIGAEVQMQGTDRPVLRAEWLLLYSF